MCSWGLSSFKIEITHPTLKWVHLVCINFSVAREGQLHFCANQMDEGRIRRQVGNQMTVSDFCSNIPTTTTTKTGTNDVHIKCKFMETTHDTSGTFAWNHQPSRSVCRIGKIISDSVNARSISGFCYCGGDLWQRKVTHSMHSAHCTHWTHTRTESVYSITFGMHNSITNDKRRTNKFQNQSEIQDEILDGHTVTQFAAYEPPYQHCALRCDGCQAGAIEFRHSESFFVRRQTLNRTLFIAYNGLGFPQFVVRKRMSPLRLCESVVHSYEDQLFWFAASECIRSTRRQTVTHSHQRTAKRTCAQGKRKQNILFGFCYTHSEEGNGEPNTILIMCFGNVVDDIPLRRRRCKRKMWISCDATEALGFSSHQIVVDDWLKRWFFACAVQSLNVIAPFYIFLRIFCASRVSARTISNRVFRTKQQKGKKNSLNSECSVCEPKIVFILCMFVADPESRDEFLIWNFSFSVHISLKDLFMDENLREFMVRYI